MRFDQVIKENTPAARVTIGSDEVRGIAQSGKITSKGPSNPYQGHTYFDTNPKAPTPKAVDALNQLYGSDTLKPGQKMGYVMKTDPANLQTPPQNLPQNTQGTFKTLAPDSPAQSIQSIQKIQAPQQPGQSPTLGKERDFGKFMQKYNGIINALKGAKVSPGAGAAGLMRGGGGGITGKFTPNP